MKKNLALCIPSARFVDFSFFRSFANCIGQVMLSWNTAVFTVSSPYIQENRNQILRKIFSFEAANSITFDYLLWLDTDMAFDFKQVEILLSHLETGANFVSGVYYNPHEKEIRPVAYLRNGESYAWLGNETDLRGIIEIDAVGFGFCAMKNEVARKIFDRYAPRPFDLRYLGNGSMVGEDQVFCERAKSLGYKIMLDSSIVVKHAKGYLPPQPFPTPK